MARLCLQGLVCTVIRITGLLRSCVCRGSQSCPYNSLARVFSVAAKNYTKGYSDVHVKVRNTTANEPWGPSSGQMDGIAQMSYNPFALTRSALLWSALIPSDSIQE
jgi:hypothetical protein